MKFPRAQIALSVLSILFISVTFASARTKPTGKRWMDMNYGPYVSASVEAPGRNMTYKGILVRVSGETTNAANNPNNATMLFDTDLLRYGGAWTGGFLNMRSIVWDGSHGTHPTVNGKMTFATPQKPGWANADGSFDDPRTKIRSSSRTRSARQTSSSCRPSRSSTTVTRSSATCSSTRSLSR